MKVQCPHCKKVLSVPDDYKGKRIKCKDCQGVLIATSPEKQMMIPPKKEPISTTKKEVQNTKNESPKISEHLICDNCQKRIRKFGHIIDDNQIICDICYRQKHQNLVTRKIVPFSESHKLIAQIRCSVCLKDMWIPIASIHHKIQCIYCNGLFFPEEFSDSFLLIDAKLHSLKVAVWTIAVIIIITVVIAIISAINYSLEQTPY